MLRREQSWRVCEETIIAVFKITAKRCRRSHLKGISSPINWIVCHDGQPTKEVVAVLRLERKDTKQSSSNEVLWLSKIVFE